MKAASSFETGAAFAAFCVNFQLLLEKYGLRLRESDSDQVYRDMFALYESAIETYFGNFSLKGIYLAPETGERWQSGVMIAELDNWNRFVALPEGCGAFLDYAREFFPLFFGNVFRDVDQTWMPVDQVLAAVFTELALGALTVFLMREAALFLPASSDMRRRAVAH